MSTKDERHRANQSIVYTLTYLVDQWPDMRFTQLLQTLDINRPLIKDGVTQGLIDNFNEESKATLRNMQAALVNMGEKA